MTNEKFAMQLDYSYALLNPASIITEITEDHVTTTVVKQEPTKAQIDACREGLRELLKECKNRGWLPS